MAGGKRVVSEGGVDILVPDEGGEVDSSMEVFYNPAMESNRDISVSFVDVVHDVGDRYLDCHGGTGIRGLRLASSIQDLDVTINDWSRDAVSLVKENAELNSLEVEVSCEDANILMSKRKFDIIDLDPFGSPVPYLDAAARSISRGGFLCMTATDTAPLSGAHKKAGVRRYSAVPLNTPYHKEVGARILFGKAASVLSQYDLSAESYLTYYKDHYFRVYLRVEKGAKRANETIGKMGYIAHCFNCSYRETVTGLERPLDLPRECICGETLSFCGPLFLGNLYNEGVLAKLKSHLSSVGFGTSDSSAGLIDMCLGEAGYPPTFYDIHKLCKMESLAAPKTQDVLDCLMDRGFIASRTHFSPLGIKTDAEVSVVKEVLRELN
ncbi:tRNA (guanine(10)-N(2))-dimethyltransferase [Methanonatronarchaeum sp. AMET6-2]|uniref:tRNA (guanine(10)-N(2))-dimethyltransferase n=1 Tax=Methanonatronarchaeum sp. AMET6-2 TaxID=2933293 RepID=UPI00121A8397|nr:tRNA (guanine(10)-N(2))-dimethyltransferase [Methanonatronarchaeum sp. AMET6-2]RZN62837.1 MAG: tRNA (guanine(10)-N(2))-dimethyltransferase [Methanonatronarchaeia archaeon]UOY09511.1 tRNA (guanine(10)-N(2))-dimethyltransferase [Methanonatronarchaeum sp. AMET6-2]